MIQRLITSFMAVTVVGLGLFIYLTLPPSVSFSAPDYLALQPSSVFQAPCPGTMAFQGAAASTDFLYFLCFSRKRTPQLSGTVFQTTLDGKLRSQFDVAGTYDLHLTTDLEGRALVFRRLQPSASIVDMTSHLSQSIDVGGPADYLVATQEGIFRVAQNGVSRSDWRGDPSIPLTLKEAFLAFPSSTHHIAIVGLLTAQLFVLDDHSLLHRTPQLPAPEISGVARNTAQGEGALFSAASDLAGHIYVITAPFKASQGVVIAEFDENGVLLNRFRCTLPTLQAAATSHNPLGFLTPAMLEIAGHTMFLMDPHENTVAAYLLP